MGKLVNKFDIEESFWEINPEFKSFGPFGKMYKSDKSRNKRNTSKIAWFVVYLCDRGSPYKNVPYEERLELIDDDFGKGYYEENKEKINSLIKYYETALESPAEKQLRIIEKKFEEKNQLLESTPYTIENYEHIDKMLKSNESLFKVYEQAKKSVEEENEKGRTRGGESLSLEDEGEI